MLWGYLPLGIGTSTRNNIKIPVLTEKKILYQKKSCMVFYCLGFEIYIYIYIEKILKVPTPINHPSKGINREANKSKLQVKL